MDGASGKGNFDPVLPEAPKNASFQFVANAELSRELGHRETYRKSEGRFTETRVERHRRRWIGQQSRDIRDAGLHNLKKHSLHLVGIAAVAYANLQGR